MQRSRPAFLFPLWLMVGFCLGLAGQFLCPVQAAGRKTDEVREFFDQGAIPEVHLEIAKTNLLQLRRNGREYVRATVREGDRTYTEVGLHLKGAAGSFQPIDGDKPAFTLNFDKYVDGQNFHGMDKLALNNSNQDPAYLTEAICSELFLAAGVPTPRTTHARVWLNGRSLGLYVLKEGFDKAFLRGHFKNVKGNLYDGGFLRDVDEPLERTSGEAAAKGRADLKALVAAARETDRTQRMARLEEVLDVDRFLSFAALEVLTWHWDGYVYKKNNYRLYHDPESGKVVFFPHGMDQMFWDPTAPVQARDVLRRTEGLVARAILETDEGRRRYHERVGVLLTNVFTLERLTNHLQQLRTRLRPVVATLSTEEARKYENAVNNVSNSIVRRLLYAPQKFTEPEPQRLRFSAEGIAALTNWQKLDIRATGRLEELTNVTGRVLHVAALEAGNCTASWRTRVHLRPGNYIFEGQVRTAGVVPLAKDTTKKGIGAGLRLSQSQPRQHSFTGDNDWQSAQYEFSVDGDTTDVWLLCELRAEKGEAWFNLDSLRLRQVDAPAKGSKP